jgi:hypothetical protein
MNGHVPKGTCGLMGIQHPAVLDDHPVVSAQSQLSTCGGARPFSNLYTAVDTPTTGRVVVCLVFVCLVFVCKYVLGHSRVYSSDGESPAGDGLLSHSTKKNEHEHQDIGHSTPNPGKFGAVAEGDFYQPETPTAHQVVNGQRLARS